MIKFLFLFFRFLVIALQKSLKFFTFGYFSPPFTAVLGIIRQDNEILLIERSDKLGLGLPGGFMTIYESVEEALQREVREETGLTVTVGKLAGILSGIREKTGISTVDLIYECDISGDNKLKDSIEGKCKWLDLNTLNPDMITFDYFKIIKNYQS